MKKYMLLIVVGLMLSIGSESLSAQAGATRPVVVVNTPTNPVPVEGDVRVTNTPTVDARQSGMWSVAVAGSPTVKIDPNNNTVKLNRTGTSLVANILHNYIASSSTFQIVNVSEFAKIRMQLANLGASDVEVTVSTSDLSALPSVYLFEHEVITIPAGGRASRLYDTLGTYVNLRFSSEGSGSVRLGVFGSGQ